MNAPNNNLEREIEARLNLLDQFRHPAVTEDLAGRIVKSMAQAHRRGRVWGRIVRIGFPIAAAAGIILAVSLFTSGTGNTGDPSATGEIVSIWALADGSEMVEQVFAELNFEDTTTQPTAKSDALRLEDDLDQALIEAVCSS